MEQAKTQIAAALKSLGVKGKISMEHISFNTYRVFVCGGYFGTFDPDRDTFVD